MNDIQQPKAKKIPKKLIHHNHQREDNYYWLRTREDPEVIEYLQQENAYAKSKLQHTEKLQEGIYDEIVGRIQQQDESVPYFSNGYYYYSKFLEGGEYPIHCRKKSASDSEEIMIDVNKIAENQSYCSVSGLGVSKNNRLLAFGVDTIGRRQYKIYVKDLSSGEVFDYELDHTSGYVAWANDSDTFFYAQKNQETLRSEKIMRFSLSQQKKELVYHEQDEAFITFVYKTKSQKYIFVGSYNIIATEYQFIDANEPTAKMKIIQPRQQNLEYSVDHYEDKFYILTNDNAPNFKLVQTSTSQYTKEYWQDILPHQEDALLENIEIFKNYLVVEQKKMGLTQLRIIKWEDFSEYCLPFDDPAYTSYISVNKEFETDWLRYGYTSLTTPNSIFDINMATREKVLKKQNRVVGDFASTNYVSERLFATASDGTQIPISLVYHKDKKQQQGNPLLLNGYGAYGHCYEPGFSSVRLSLLDRGFIFAIAHIRGGQEMGRDWYEKGKLFDKKNTFSDFICCAEHLIAQKYTVPQQIFAEGGSAGGLLVGTVINLRPELFKGVIAQVPFVDIVTTMLDESIPLTTGEYGEWGNPNIEDVYHYMLSYSPYDNIAAKNYPHILVSTGLYDSQVQYWEPAKWVAKLREIKTDDNLLLFVIDMDAGHHGVSGRFKQFKLVALEYAFLLSLVNCLE